MFNIHTNAKKFYFKTKVCFGCTSVPAIIFLLTTVKLIVELVPASPLPPEDEYGVALSVLTSCIRCPWCIITIGVSEE